jgi:alpha-ketoglutarate-dependent taurine dioxygenase
VLPPKSEDGGQTQFASLRAAYDALPPARKAQLEGKAAMHQTRITGRSATW